MPPSWSEAMKVILAATAALLILSACFEEEQPQEGEKTLSPTQEPTVVATVGSLVPNEEEPPDPTETPDVTPIEPEASATPAAIEEEPPAPTPTPAIIEEPEARPDTLPTMEFPDDIAVLTHHYHVWPGDGPLGRDLERIYWRDGELVRETVFDTFLDDRFSNGDELSRRRCESGDYSRAGDYSDIQAFAGRLPICRGGYDMDLAFSPDGSSIVMTICVEGVCHPGRYPDVGPDYGAHPGRTAIYESQDGGVTWEQLADFDVPWVARGILPAEDGDTRLWLQPGWAFFKDADGLYTEWLPSTFWSSSGGVEEQPDPPSAPDGYRWSNSSTLLDDGRFAWRFSNPPAYSSTLYLTQEGEDVTDLVLEDREDWEDCWSCLNLPDGRLFLMEDYDVEDLIGPYGAAEGRAAYHNRGRGGASGVVSQRTFMAHDPGPRDWRALADPDALRSIQGGICSHTTCYPAGPLPAGRWCG